MGRRIRDAYLYSFRLFLFGLGFTTGRLARLGFIIIIVVFLSIR
jgi:hypothetical protein